MYIYTGVVYTDRDSNLSFRPFFWTPWGMHVVSIPRYPYTQEISVNYLYTRGSSNLQTFRGYNNEMFEVPFMYPNFILWIQSTNVLRSPHILFYIDLKFAINLIDLKNIIPRFLPFSILPNTSLGRWFYENLPTP